MSEKLKLTAAQHAAAIARSDENIALRSGAGCGKTFVLARRFTELLMRRGASEDALDRFVALTFTEKAAIEMADRVRKTLYELAQRGRRPGRRLLLKWIERLPEARIGTIHSFCAALLRAHAVEAEIDPDFQVCAEPMRLTQMKLTAAEETIGQELEDDNSLAAELLLAVPYRKTLDLLLTLIDARTSWNPGDYDSAEKILTRWKQQTEVVVRELWAELAADSALRREMDGIASLPCQKPMDKLAGHREEQLAIIGRMLSSAEPASVEQLGQLSSAGNLGSDKAWSGRAKEVRHRLKDLVARFKDFTSFAEPIGELDGRAAAQLAALTALAAKALSRYAAAKRAEGILDFTDLLESAYRLLRDKPHIQGAVAAGIDQLLVDECQDTNALQVALLERLMFGQEGGTELPAGRLFLVGDGKQSIYRFRGAQVEVFEDWCRRLGPAQREDLDVSFRTHPAGAGFVNHLFATLMGGGYSPIHAKRAESPPAPSVEILLAGCDEAPEKVNAEQATRAQAAVMARRIRQMVQRAERRVWDETTDSWRPVRFGDIAVLFARMTNLGAYERELAAQEVPYYVLAGAGFFKQQEVYDLLGALRVVDNAFDDISFFGILRSSLFGLDDESLLRIAETFRPPYLPALAEALGAETPHERLAEMCGLDASAASIVAEACGLLATLHRRKDALGIPRLLESLLEKTGYEAALLGQVQGRQRVGNVRLLLDMARTASMEGMGLAAFIAQAESMIVHQDRYEQAAISSERDNVVRLMTIHRAKGLEFPVVFIPDLNSGKRPPRSPLINRSGLGLTLNLRANDDSGSEAEDRDGSAVPVSFRLAKKLEETDDQKEDIRKLYVSVTRHRDHLVLVGADWRNKDGLSFKDSGGFLHEIDEVFGLRAALDAGESSVAYDQGRFQAMIEVVQPAGGTPASRARSMGRRLVARANSADELAGLIKSQARSDPPPTLLGPLPAGLGRPEVAVTALCEYACCPMRYRWQHQLRVNPHLLGNRPTTGAAGLDAATRGTLLHHCMEHLDFARPQPARRLVRRAVAELDLQESADEQALTGELAEMLDRFKAQPLWSELAEAKQLFRELDFVMAVPPGVLRGQIDLLYQDAEGQWHILDYKSDRVAEEHLAAHAKAYEIQMLSYALAAGKYLATAIPSAGPGSPGKPSFQATFPAEAKLYFLRIGRTYRFPLERSSIETTESELAKLLSWFLASETSGRFPPAKSDRCTRCPYKPLCP